MRNVMNGEREVVNHMSLPADREAVVRMAYDDIAAGRPFHPDYDTWARHDQQNYERARLYALNLRTAGMQLPFWPQGWGHPPIFWRMLAYTIHTIGDPLPLPKDKVLEIVQNWTETE